MSARSGWQGFDAKNERKRLDEGMVRDTFLLDEEGEYVLDKRGEPRVKQINVLVHERMSDRPFVAFDEFDIFEFSDYGRIYYDNNKKVDGVGTTFLTPRRIERQEQKDARQRAKMEQRRTRKNRVAKGENT